LQPVVYQDGSYLIEYNTLGEWFFLILEGEVDVYGRDKKGEVLYVCSFGVGDCVGELEFINHHRTVADVRAKGRIKVARLHRDHFEMCMGPLVDVLKRTATADERYAYYQSVIRTMRRDTD
jgi:CRP-like cAMP-binding protein